MQGGRSHRPQSAEQGLAQGHTCGCRLQLLLCLVLLTSVSRSLQSPCCSPSRMRSAILTHHAATCVSLSHPRAPAVLTSSIRHVFIAQQPRCRFRQPHPVDFLEFSFPFPDIPMGTAHLSQCPPDPWPISPFEPFLSPAGLGKSLDLGPVSR